MGFGSSRAFLVMHRFIALILLTKYGIFNSALIGEMCVFENGIETAVREFIERTN